MSDFKWSYSILQPFINLERASPQLVWLPIQNQKFFSIFSPLYDHPALTIFLKFTQKIKKKNWKFSKKNQIFWKF